MRLRLDFKSSAGVKHPRDNSKGLSCAGNGEQCSVKLKYQLALLSSLPGQTPGGFVQVPATFSSRQGGHPGDS